MISREQKLEQALRDFVTEIRAYQSPECDECEIIGPLLRQADAVLSAPKAEAVIAHPIAKFGSGVEANPGLYRVHWKSGGTSLASIGMGSNGDRWIAPTNWLRPATVAEAGEWGDIERLEPIDPVPALINEAERFESADWFFRTMDPDDSGDSPAEAIHSGMIGHFVVCEIASSFNGPTRYGFNAPVLDPESNDEEFLHFASEDEAIAAAKTRAALSST